MKHENIASIDFHSSLPERAVKFIASTEQHH
jgi:hypothetical protein